MSAIQMMYMVLTIYGILLLLGMSGSLLIYLVSK